MQQEKTKNIVAQRVRQIRREKGINQEELANNAEINRSYLSSVENGKSSPTIEVVERLAKGLGVSIAELMMSEKEKHFSYDSGEEFEMYDGLKQLLESEDEMMLMRLSIEEVDLLKGIRLRGSHKPSKRFFVDALLDYRRSLK
ncbi:MAG: helix-turn-helix transcriptional regulator [Calditrichaeota bacterium]|nr:helix-turn-helix transcriptional regulator [Calditrichota bacterium]MBT7616499.1 helix-turn-helix transcriptional regulator [Calditrichota bacterium]MBT7790342.1 helix-turn-helix transcriptional regulator [Calditrichota bacterium]